MEKDEINEQQENKNLEKIIENVKKTINTHPMTYSSYMDQSLKKIREEVNNIGVMKPIYKNGELIILDENDIVLYDSRQHKEINEEFIKNLQSSEKLTTGILKQAHNEENSNIYEIKKQQALMAEGFIQINQKLDEMKADIRKLLKVNNLNTSDESDESHTFDEPKKSK